MTMGMWVLPQDVRDYANISGNLPARYTNDMIGSNILAAQRFLQRTTGRQWEAETTTKTFTTEGRAQISIPDLRSVTSVTLSTAALTVDNTYWLLPSKQDSTIYTGIQVRPFTGGNRGPWYLGVPDWWDRNLDSIYYRGGQYSSLPNDLVIAGNWGWSPVPADVQLITKIMAAWYTLRPDAVLANAKVTPEGALLSYMDLPTEVGFFIGDWKVGEQAVLV